jgi:hypothetical protein
MSLISLTAMKQQMAPEEKTSTEKWLRGESIEFLLFLTCAKVPRGWL